MNLTNTTINSETIEKTTTSGWYYFKLILNWFREIIMWIAEKISGYINIPANIIYLILLGLTSVAIISKIFHTQNTTIRGRYFEFIIYVLIIFLLLKYL